MSQYAEYLQLVKTIAEAQVRMQEIESDPVFVAEKEFDQNLRALLAEYGKSLRDIVAILDPSHTNKSSVEKKSGERATRSPRALQTFLNPHTNEVVETKGGNNKMLNAWKAQYGKDVVRSWLKVN